MSKSDDSIQDHEEDYLSNLPHSLIIDILSRLHVKYAVRTSVLSRYWKCKWLSIYDIEVDDKSNCFHGTDATASLASVVTRILLRTRNSKLRSFRLTWLGFPCHCGHFETWISHVLKRGVQNLEISARILKRLDSQWCFSGWGLLTELKLEMSCTLKVPADNCFPNLKSLRLCSGVRGDLKIVTTKCPGSGDVVLDFPVLAVLQLSRCEWLDVDSVEIQAPELLWFTSSSSREFDNYEVKICAPQLVVFELRGRGPFNNYLLSSPEAVTCAVLSDRFGNETYALQAHKILTEFSNLKCLRIHGDALQVLLHLKPELVFPTFDRLRELEINNYCAIKDVMELLQVLPPLKLLIMNVWTLDEYEFTEALTPKTVSQLYEVKLLDFTATKGQYELATYLLENAKNLNKLTVNLQKDALNFKRMTVEDGKSIDIVEAVGESLSELKLSSSSCEVLVE